MKCQKDIISLFPQSVYPYNIYVIYIYKNTYKEYKNEEAKKVANISFANPH